MDWRCAIQTKPTKIHWVSPHVHENTKNPPLKNLGKGISLDFRKELWLSNTISAWHAEGPRFSPWHPPVKRIRQQTVFPVS